MQAKGVSSKNLSARIENLLLEVKERYEKILVPLDGSELAEVALPYAEELAGRLGSEGTLLYVSESAEGQYHRIPQFYMQ